MGRNNHEQRMVTVCGHSSLIRTRPEQDLFLSYGILTVFVGYSRAVILIYVISNQHFLLFPITLGGILLTASHNPGGKYSLPTMSQPNHWKLNQCSSFSLFLLLPHIFFSFVSLLGIITFFRSVPSGTFHSLSPHSHCGLLLVDRQEGGQCYTKKRFIFLLLCNRQSSEKDKR